MTDGMAARAATTVSVSHVIIRACTRCGHPREQGVPCGGCGNPDPPVVHDLGVQAFASDDPERMDRWVREGQYAAAARAEAAARYVPER